MLINQITFDFEKICIEVIIRYIYSGVAELSTLNRNQLIELVKILSKMDLELLLKAALIRLINENEAEA
jgi:hypothetical protein